MVELVAIEEAEERMMGLDSSISKVIQKLAFNVIIVSVMGI